MGIIKFEVDIPDFDNELSMTITLRKDGEVVESISRPSSEKTSSKPKSKSQKKNLNTTSLSTSNVEEGGGNLMNMDFDN